MADMTSGYKCWRCAKVIPRTDPAFHAEIEIRVTATKRRRRWKWFHPECFHALAYEIDRRGIDWRKHKP